MGSPLHGLYTLVDNSLTPHYSHVWLAEQYLKGGARILQLRKKGGKPPFKEARQIASLKKDYPFVFIVNDFPEVVLEVRADGFHGGQEDISSAEARKVLGPKVLIGYSSHSLGEAIQAEEKGADYVAFGAIFPTATKGPNHPIQGIEKLHEVCQRLTVPVVAIGGINRTNLGQVIKAGASAVAMISGLTKSENIANEVAWYVERFS